MSNSDLTNTYRNQLNRALDARKTDLAIQNLKAETAYQKEVYAKANAACLKDENEMYRKLLSRPLAEIANFDHNFKRAYDAQQELLADWMVSQKAFKEIAIKFGLQLGKTKEEVLAEGLATEENVLNNTTVFDNNAEDSSIISPHIDNLKAKINKN